MSQSYSQIPTLIKPQAQKILGGLGDVFYQKKKKKKTTGKEKFKHDHPCYLKSGVLRPTRKLTPQRKKLNTVSTVFIIIVLQVFHKTITMFSYCGPATNMRQLYA